MGYPLQFFQKLVSWLIDFHLKVTNFNNLLDLVNQRCSLRFIQVMKALTEKSEGYDLCENRSKSHESKNVKREGDPILIQG